MHRMVDCERLISVPELTFFNRVNLNAQVLLRHLTNPLQQRGPLTGLSRRATVLGDFEDASIDPRASWACVWHIWTLIIPRRSIDGSRVWGVFGDDMMVETGFTDA